jgi:hypothetical protein
VANVEDFNLVGKASDLFADNPVVLPVARNTACRRLKDCSASAA